MSESKICPSCNEKNHPQLNKCWKCGCVFDATALERENKKPTKENINRSNLIKIIVAIAASSFILNVIADYCFFVINQGAFFLKSLFLGLPLAAISINILMARKNGVSAKAKGCAIFCLVISMLGLTFASGKLINGFFDGGGVQVRSALVLKKTAQSTEGFARDPSSGTGTLKNLYIQSWRSTSEAMILPVRPYNGGDRKIFYSSVPNKTKIKITTKSGLFGSEWLKSYEIESA